MSPQISSDVPVKGVDEVSLVERLDVESTIPVSASQLLVPPKKQLCALPVGVGEGRRRGGHGVNWKRKRIWKEV